jgi:hypothetical protein
MNVPNLASRPFLNTRPVWLVTVAAGAVALVLAAINVQLFAASNRNLAAQLERKDELTAEYAAIRTAARSDITALDRVNWRSLHRQVEGLNVILREHEFSWLALLDDVERVMPYDVRLIRIAPSIDKSKVELSLECVAKTREAMLGFLDNLINDPSFADPIPQWERHPDASEVVGYTFTVEVNYLPVAEAAP